MPQIPCDEDARLARFQWVRVPVEPPSCVTGFIGHHVLPREKEAVRVPPQPPFDARCDRLGADEQEPVPFRRQLVCLVVLASERDAAQVGVAANLGDMETTLRTAIRGCWSTRSTR